MSASSLPSCIMNAEQPPNDLPRAQQEIERLRKALEESERVREAHWQTICRLLPPPPDDYLQDESEWFSNIDKLETLEHMIDDVFGKEK